MKRSLAKTLLLLLVVLLFVSCSNTLQVISPKASQTSSQEFSVADGHITIIIKFNRAVDQSTVVVGKTLVLKSEKDPNATGTLTWSTDSKAVTFRTTKTAQELLDFDPDGHFMLKLIGSDTGNGAIKDQAGKHLDGESNNADGGDFQTAFTLIG